MFFKKTPHKSKYFYDKYIKIKKNLEKEETHKK